MEKREEQTIHCSVYDCHYCDCDKDCCNLKEIKVCNCDDCVDDKEATMCDSFKKKND